MQVVWTERYILMIDCSLRSFSWFVHMIKFIYHHDIKLVIEKLLEANLLTRVHNLLALYCIK